MERIMCNTLLVFYTQTITTLELLCTQLLKMDRKNNPDTSPGNETSKNAGILSFPD